MADQPVSLPTATSVLLETSDDALILLESVRQGLLPRTVRRLSKADRDRYIRDGAVFIWEEKETQMQRWTDGKKWSCSKVAGDFLVYEELSSSTEGSSSQAPSPKIDNGLIKQTFSVNLQLPDQSPKKFHVISYHCPKSIGKLSVPSFDPAYVGLNLSCWKHPSASSHSSSIPNISSESSSTSIPTSMNISSSSSSIQSPFPASGPPSPDGAHGSFSQPRPESDGVSRWINPPLRTGPTSSTDELLARPYPPRQPRSATFAHQPPKSGPKHRRDRSRSWTASERSSPSSSNRSYPLEAMSSDPTRFVHSRPSSPPFPVDWPPVQPTAVFLPLPLQPQMSSSSTSSSAAPPFHTSQSYAHYPTQSSNHLPPRQPGFLQPPHRPASMPSIPSYENDSFSSRCSTDSSLFAGSDGRTLPLPSTSKSLPSTSTGDSDGHPHHLQGNRLVEKGWKPGLDQESKRMLSMLGFNI